MQGFGDALAGLSATLTRAFQDGRAEFTTVETPEEVADTIGRALQFVPRDRLIACTNCGLAPMTREVAEAKLRALAQGAALARQRHGLAPA